MTLFQVIKKPIKESSSTQKYPFEEMGPGMCFDAGEYSEGLQRSIYGCIAYYKKKRGNGKKVFSTVKTKSGRLEVWRDK